MDSSVAAALLKERGYEVIGCFMRLGSEDGVEPAETSCRLDGAAGSERSAGASGRGRASGGGHASGGGGGGRGHKQGCCSVLDAADARLVAAQLDIPLYVVNFREDFGRIIRYFEDEYHQGRTPNPCVRCNQWLKFGRLARYAASIDADYISTGHYVRVVRDESGRALLQRGLHQAKDQSYALFGIDRAMVDRMLLPIGDYPKDQVREMARQRDLQVFEKPDSQEICFVPDQDYVGLLRRRQPERFGPGKLVDTSGKLLAEHQGHQSFTIGQRRGLPIALGYPIYVVHRDAASNTVVVGGKDDLLSPGLEADEANWLIDPPGDRFECTVKIRYNGRDVPATVERDGGDAFRVRFDEPQPAVSPGQAVVCYHGPTVLGGGWIRRALGA
ncbi:MAG: tRNA 2-thiouridine(34) synthase MnmA [Phycisphaeraceae bacterium]|nr:tRNA 2-thiouridine(34) synthase MnmA [Phycisphaeraceae bacterium]